MHAAAGEVNTRNQVMDTTRVLIIDDKTLTRRGLSLLIEQQEDMKVVGEFECSPDIREKVSEAGPDVILIDIDSSDPRIFDLINVLSDCSPTAYVLALSEEDDYAVVHHALQSGATGYLLKDASVDELYSAIRTVRSGEVFMHPRVTTKLVGHYLNRRSNDSSESDPYDKLSNREREILPLLSESLSNIEIGVKLQISPYTVQTYRQRIMRKLDLHNKTDLLRYAIRKGLVNLFS